MAPGQGDPTAFELATWHRVQDHFTAPDGSTSTATPHPSTASGARDVTRVQAQPTASGAGRERKQERRRRKELQWQLCLNSRDPHALVLKKTKFCIPGMPLVCLTTGGLISAQ